MSDSALRTRRDRITDLAWVLVTAGGDLIGAVTSADYMGGRSWVHGHASLALGVDLGLGALASAMLWFRRRWPVGVAVAMLVPMALARTAQVASLASLLNVSLRSRLSVVVALVVAQQAAFIGVSLLWITYPWWWANLWVLAYRVAIVALCMYARARRRLIESLHEQVRQAEATRDLMAEQARQAERARIAIEMHDVLAHRVSLMALHAGGLEVRPDLPPEAVRETAGLIRSTGRQALTELRDIIGVLRDTDRSEVPHGPQPKLGDVGHLVDGYRQAGLNVKLDMEISDPDAAPGPLGRDAYRIVREALTNVSKHASGTAATVSLSGRPGEGLRVTVRNKLPVAGPRAAELPGAGLGLVSLEERVTLAGGTLAHGPDGNGDFVLTATLRWED